MTITQKTTHCKMTQVEMTFSSASLARDVANELALRTQEAKDEIMHSLRAFADLDIRALISVVSVDWRDRTVVLTTTKPDSAQHISVIAQRIAKETAQITYSNI